MGTINDDVVEELVAAPGTGLLIGQMNLMRHVTAGQYAHILLNLLADEAPPVDPVDDTERAQRGVAALIQNVWPVLRWGTNNTAVLEARLREIASLEVYEAARELALRNLPVRVDLSPQLFVVMGGRAGAAALAEDRIYVDLLMLSFLETRGRPAYDARNDLVTYFAHEMHHIGFRRIQEARRDSLNLGLHDALAYDLLSALVAEGSATLLIDGRGDFQQVLERSNDIALLAGQVDTMLGDLENVLAKINADKLSGRNQLDADAQFLLGSGLHAAGAVLLDRIRRDNDPASVTFAIEDPRRLLVEYNAAVARTQLPGNIHVFDRKLAADLARIGE